MKFLKKIASFALCCAFAGGAFFGLSACGSSELSSEGPAQTDVVIGNGGLSVQKGDYLYFVNGYLEQSDIEAATKESNIIHSAIYRVKLTNGKVTEIDGDEANKEFKLKNTCKVVSKVAGFEYSNLYIFGDYLYFSTPNTRSPTRGEETTNDSGNLLDHIDFYRVKLDGTHEQRIYSCDSVNTDTDMAMFVVGDKFYQVIKDGKKLVLTVDNGKVMEKVISEKATSVAFPLYKNDQSFNINKFVFYTEDLGEEDDVTGSKIMKYDLEKAESEQLLGGDGETYTLFGMSGDCVFYTYKQTSAVGAYIYCQYYDGKKFETAQLSDMVYSTTITKFIPASSDFQGSILFYDGTNTYFRQVSMDANVKYDPANDLVLTSTDVISKLVTVKGNKIYYNDSGLNSIVFNQSNPEAQSEITVDTPVTTNVANFDVNGDAIFYLVNRNDHAYLHYTNSLLRDAKDKNVEYHHFVGQLLEDDYELKEED